jgi:hypothetical protein
MKKNFAAFVDEDELDGVVRGLGDGSDLCGYPSLILVLEPDASTLAVDVLRHGSGRET